jgi:LmbE family N-acetylglucosaminyl deacetylase
MTHAPNKRIAIFIAHADDTEFMAGGTVAKFASEGWEITEVIATNNERGTHDLAPETIIRQSRDEAREAARILGKKEVRFLEYSDGMLADTPVNELREKFIAIIRELKPRIVMTWDPFASFEPHPDHRQVAMAATEAAGFSHMPRFHPEHLARGLSTHYVPEKWFFAKRPTGQQTVIDIAPFIQKKIDALCAHDSQMRLTIDDIGFQLAAIDPENPAIRELDRANYRPAVDKMARAIGNRIGKPAGLEYAETFRIERIAGLAAAFTGVTPTK